MRDFETLLPILATLALASAQSQCEFPGICHGFNLEHTSTNSTEGCHEFCEMVDGCGWYTYDTETEVCYTFPNCTEIDPSCLTCTTGKVDCVSHTCFVQGECHGQLIHYMSANSGQDCLRECQAESTCNWFSFDNAEMLCVLMEDCKLDGNATSFVSGERHCDVGVIDNSKLFIQQFTTTSWIDMPNLLLNTSDCSPTPLYPMNVNAATGAVINGKITVCGGQYSAKTPMCFSLLKNINIWEEFPSMPEARSGPGYLITDKGWWITGGYNDSSLVGVTGTYILNSTSTVWEMGPELPSARGVHCIAQINSAFSFLAGGLVKQDGTGELSDTWIYSWAEGNWTQFPSMPVPKYEMACSPYTDQEGRQHIIVAGNETTVQSFDLETMSWSVLPDLPAAASNSPTLIQDGQDLFLVDPNSGRIMQFIESNSTFAVLPGKTTGVIGENAVVIPIDDFVLHGC